jgi:endonuclease/exonuclease/phosphatase family metal-dependent hydrolase
VAAHGTPTTPSRRLFDSGHRIDWAFVRGPMRAGSGQVYSRISASDHYPISFALTRSKS